MTVYRECVDSTVYGTVRAHSAETARGRRTVEQRRDGQASKRDAHCGCRKGNKKVRTKFIVRGARVYCGSKTLHRCTCKKLRVMNVRRSTPTRQRKIHGDFFFFFLPFDFSIVLPLTLFTCRVYVSQIGKDTHSGAKRWENAGL